MQALTAPATPRNAVQADAEVSHDFEAEQEVLGTLLVNNVLVAKVSSILRPEHFSDEGHVALYRVILMQVDRGAPASPLSLARWADGQGIPNFDTAYLRRLARVSWPDAEALEKARTVQRHHLRRTVQRVLASDDGLRDIGEELRSALVELGGSNRAALDLSAHRVGRWIGKEVPTIPMMVDGLEFGLGVSICVLKEADMAARHSVEFLL